MTAHLRRPALALLLWSALVLLLCSGTSPLYAFHDWTDANTYLTMGRGLLAGAVPYRDLFDHKGPLLYAVYALGAALDPGGFAGVFCLQCLSLALTLYGVYRLALCLGSEPVPALLCACALPLFLLSAGVYYLPDALDYGGGSAEEFCLPLFSLSLWLPVREEKPGGWALLALGGLAGCAAQIKFSLCLFWAGLLAPCMLCLLFRRRGWALVRALALLALGFVLSWLPYLAYALYTGSLGDFWSAYVLFNRDYAAVGVDSLRELPRRAAEQAVRALAGAPAVCLALLAGAWGCRAARAAPVSGRAGVLLSAAGLGWAIFSGRTMPYTLLPLLLYAGVGLAALAGRLPAPRRPALAAGLLLPLLLLFTASANQMLLHKPLFCSSVPTCQETIAARIRSGPYRDPTVLEAGMLSRGFYNELGLIPPVRFFYLPNIPDALHPEILDSQLSAISRRAADYVILQSGDPDISKGRLPEDPRQAQLFRAAFQQYRLEAVIPGTGAVDHLFYYLFLRRPPLQTEPAAWIAR